MSFGTQIYTIQIKQHILAHIIMEKCLVRYYEETLYKNEEDEFFIINSAVDSDEGDLILLPDEEELLAWAENHLDVDLYIKYFGAVSE